MFLQLNCLYIPIYPNTIQGDLTECQPFFPVLLAFVREPDYHEMKKGGRGDTMNSLFADTLKELRTRKGLSQNQLARAMFVNNTTISKWESGSRLPSADMIARLARVLEVNVATLFSASAEYNGSPNIIMVDDNKDILSYSLLILEEVVPNAMISGFNRPRQAIEYAKENRVDLALLDIELGNSSGFDLCRAVVEINPCTKVIYLTAYPDYALDAWDTNACGFMVKPLTPENVRRQLKKLHYLFPEGCEAE